MSHHNTIENPGAITPYTYDDMLLIHQRPDGLVVCPGMPDKPLLGSTTDKLALEPYERELAHSLGAQIFGFTVEPLEREALREHVTLVRETDDHVTPYVVILNAEHPLVANREHQKTRVAGLLQRINFLPVLSPNNPAY